MITLKEAFKLCRIYDSDIIYLTDSVKNAEMFSFEMTGLGIRNKYDMKNTLVTSILPHIYFGEFNGFTFVLKRNDDNR